MYISYQINVPEMVNGVPKCSPSSKLTGPLPVFEYGNCGVLQGLCKLGSAGGTDFSMKQFAEGSTLKLAKQCRKYVSHFQACHN